jgi:geranylgeranyl reductase family protein
MAPVRHCDVLVVGLGPAGAAAAAAAARAGLDVVAVDRRETVGVPVQCAEFIPLPIGRHAQAPGVLLQRIAGMTSVLPSGAVHRRDFSGLMIDRARFDQALADAAREAGADLLLRTAFGELDPGARRAILRDRHGPLEIGYRALIAADGPHSRTAAALGLPRLATVCTRQYTVPLEAAYADTDIWLSPAYPGGYAWMFPKGAAANLGLGMDTRFAADMKTPLDRLHAELVASGRVGREILARTGGPIPVGGLRAQLVVGDVAFVGDAAGLTHPVTGAGIAAAVISGERAGQAAAAQSRGDPDAWREYEHGIRDQFAASLGRAVRRRRWLERFWSTPAAGSDRLHRRGWIAFPEYFDDALGDAPDDALDDAIDGRSPRSLAA